MRAITSVLSVILIVILAVALVGFLWLFVSGIFNSLTSSGTSTVNESLVTISSCMKIESVYGNQVSIRNCGKGVIAQSTLGAYLDDVPLNVTISSAVINEGETGTVTLSGLWNFNAGGHTLRVTNPRVVTEAPVNAVLPDSCVMDLEFDEGSGNIAYDKSGHGNYGTINPNVSWTSDGKHGNALEFNASLISYVSLPNLSIGGTNSSTFEAWFKYKGKSLIEYSNVFGYGHAFRLFVDGANRPSFEINILITNDGGADHLSFSNPVVNRYVHLLANYNGSNYSFYVDGVLYSLGGGEGTIYKTDDDETAGYAIGGRKIPPDFNWGEIFNGTIDEVRAYNKALAPDETLILKPVSYD